MGRSIVRGRWLSELRHDARKQAAIRRKPADEHRPSLWKRLIRFGWLGWKAVVGSIVVFSVLLSYLAFRESQLENRPWVYAMKVQTMDAVAPMGNQLVFLGTMVTLHNTGHQPAFKVVMVNRFFTADTGRKALIASEKGLCHAIDHDVVGGQVLFPNANVALPVEHGEIALGKVKDAGGVFGEVLVGCVSYVDPSDRWYFLNGGRRHTTGYMFRVQRRSVPKGMHKAVYGALPVDKTTPGNEVVYTPSVFQAGTAH